MLVNRLREQLRFILPGAASAPAAEWAFVPCPVVEFMAPAQLAFAQAVYRMAAEQTQEQLQEEATIRIPAFSMN